MTLRSLCLTLGALASLATAGSLDDLHTPWNELLAAHVKGDRVDYAGVLADKTKLESYLGSLAALDSNQIRTASKAERTALYLNAYNAAVFRLILNNPASGSVAAMPKEISGAKVISVAAESLAVAEILRKKVLDPDSDARLWSLANDGSLSAAALVPEALTSTNLERLAEERTRLWLSDTTRNKITPSSVRLATIPFDFYRMKPEFKSFAGGVPGFLKKYGPAGVDYDKNRPTYAYNMTKNAVAPALVPSKGKGKKK